MTETEKRKWAFVLGVQTEAAVCDNRMNRGIASQTVVGAMLISESVFSGLLCIDVYEGEIIESMITEYIAWQYGLESSKGEPKWHVCKDEPDTRAK